MGVRSAAAITGRSDAIVPSSPANRSDDESPPAGEYRRVQFRRRGRRVSLPASDELAAKVAGQTVASAFVDAVQRFGAATALRWKEGEAWCSLNWSEYADRVARVAAGMRSLGVEPGDRIVLMIRNVPEFHVLDTAAYFCGATPISIYNSSSPEQIRYLTNHSRAVMGIVEDEGFVGRFAKVRADLPNLRRLGVVRGSADFDYDELLSHAPIDLEAAAAAIDPGQLATVIYTSGTTGPPKGVMLTHHNVAWTVESLLRAIARDDLAGKRAHLVPTDGPHRRADDVALPRHVLRLRGRHLPRSRAAGALLPRGSPGDPLRCPACVGEVLRRRHRQSQRRHRPRDEVQRGGRSGDCRSSRRASRIVPLQNKRRRCSSSTRPRSRRCANFSASMR